MGEVGGFKFGLQPARDLAQSLKEQREAALRSAEAVLRDARGAAGEAESAVAEAESALRSLRQQPQATHHASDVRETLLLHQLEQARQSLQTARERVAEAEGKHALQREGLAEDSAQVQALDKLRDNQAAAHAKAKRQAEQRKLEDLLPSYHRR